ncbi:hypothetical protein RDABS01_013185 [Bienertia sinuspersici]
MPCIPSWFSPKGRFIFQIENCIPRKWRQDVMHNEVQQNQLLKLDTLGRTPIETAGELMFHSLLASVTGSINQGDLGKAFRAFSLIQLNGAASASYDQILKPISSLLLACSKQKLLQQGRQVHAQIITLGLDQHRPLLPRLVTLYSTFNLYPEAHLIVENSNFLHPLSWNILISAYIRNGLSNEALSTYRQMLNFGVRPDEFTYPSVLKACGEQLNLSFGREVHNSILTSKCGDSLCVQNALISMYGKCGEIEAARSLFNKLPSKDSFSWNCMISGYASKGMWEEAFNLFENMRHEAVELNIITWNTIIGGCLRTRNYMRALDFLSQMRTCGVNLDAVSMASGLSACSHIGAINTGREIHSFTIRRASILTLCARVANLQHGKELHCYIIKHQDFGEYLLLWNALVEMYARAAKIIEAKTVFDSLTRKDVVTYTSLMTGYGIIGEGKVALKLFDEMNTFGIKPDHIVLVAALSACSHSGLVIQGQLLFDNMWSVYGISPCLEHYACMVDLFGRAGLLKKAEEIIKRMPCEPSADMWATLIGACCIHRNTDLGEWAAEKLLALRPKNTGYYVLIANLYAAAGCWDKLSKVRTFMRDLGLLKTPGCAWIDIGSGFEPFVVGDPSMELSHEIHPLLEGLISMKVSNKLFIRNE